MDTSRAVQIRYLSRRFFGTGYLLSNELILTARHVLFDDHEADDPERSFKIGTAANIKAGVNVNDWPAARCRWSDRKVGAALLEVTTFPREGSAHRLAQVRWGRLTPDKKTHITSFGFPRFAKKDGQRESFWVTGHTIDPRYGVASLLRFDIDSAQPDEAMREQARAERSSPWAGMSGAALFADDFLFGLLLEDVSEGFDRAVLKVLPIREIARSETFSELVTGTTTGLILETPPDEPSAKPSGDTRRRHAVSAALWGFDLWTPGQAAHIIGKFGGHLGSREAQTLVELSSRAVTAIAHGDFHRQKEIAEKAIEIGETIPQTPVRGEGFYLKGEALRLLADFEPDRTKARLLRVEAEDYYGNAEDALGGDPRAIRGRGRTIEVLGDLDGALNLFQKSFSAIESRTTDPGEADYLSITHERVRTLRHEINCLAAIHTEMPLATPAAQRRGDKIRRLIEECEPRHRDALRMFEPYGDWWRIEWFMAEVLHAKGWAAIGEAARSARRLEWSLRQRLEMMPDEGALSAVELGNLHWWSGVATLVRPAFEFEQQRALSHLLDAVAQGASRTSIKNHGREFLRIGGAPWTAG